jgi:hypothetical protein
MHVIDGDETGTLLLQLACVLHMVHEWKGTTVLRIMIIGGAVRDRDEESHVKSLLQDLRIAADVVMVSQDSEHLKSNLHADCFLDLDIQREVNRLMCENSHEARQNNLCIHIVCLV